MSGPFKSLANKMRKKALGLIDNAQDSLDKAKALVAPIENEAVFKSPAYKGGKKWLTMYRQFDPNRPGSDFFYVERIGRDSVGFVLIDKDRPGQLGTVTQLHTTIGKFVPGAYTGSIDKEGLSIPQIVIEEVREEAGYTVDESRLHLIEASPVLTSTNEHCHLYLVDVTGLECHPKAPEGPFEALMVREWRNKEEIVGRCDWRAQVLLLALLNRGSENGKILQ